MKNYTLNFNSKTTIKDQLNAQHFILEKNVAEIEKFNESMTWAYNNQIISKKEQSDISERFFTFIENSITHK